MSQPRTYKASRMANALILPVLTLALVPCCLLMVPAMVYTCLIIACDAFLRGEKL